uniref:Leucine rich repeat containing 71 n=1 Tax=Denticeps clupeoides TaxID=299321 RepID=A0AAY4DCS7_9TELE
SGNLEIDLLELGKLLCVKEISDLTPMSQKGGTLGKTLTDHQTRWCPKPWLHVELETDDPRSVNLVKVFGWTLGGMMVKVFNKILPSLDYLKSLHFWRVGLTEETLTSLKTTMSLCTNLRTVVMEGNPLQEQSFHLFMSKDSTLAHLSLRHNHIGEEGARLIGSALSANRNLLSLNLGFNFIGDAGARHIAKGLRLNRSLLCLSLSNNGIGDAGAASLAEVLGPFPLTHEEVVERRKLLISIVHPVSDQTPGATAKKDEQKVSKKGDIYPKYISVPCRWLLISAVESQLAEVPEPVNPLLDPGVVHKDGKVIMPGNATLTSLNLSGNNLTEHSLLLFLSSLRSQGEGVGLLRLSLTRNRFLVSCEPFLMIEEIMALRNPLSRSASSQENDERKLTE